MSLERSGRDEPNEDTPPTRSYVDALLEGSLSDRDLAKLRAEIAGTQPQASEPPPEDDDADEARTRFHSYTPEEQQAAVPDALDIDASWGDDDADEARTRFHSYTPEEQRAAMADADEDDVRTAFRGPSSDALFAAFGPPTEPSPAPISLSLQDDDGDDDARTLFRPPSVSAPASSRQDPPAASGVAPVSSVRPPVSSMRPPVSSSVRPPVSSPVSTPRPPVSTPRPPLSSAAPPVSSKPPLSSRRSLGGPAFEPPLLDLEVFTPRPQEVDLSDEALLDLLGGPNGIPRLAMAAGQLTGLQLHHQAGFVMSCVDGVSTIEDILDISALGRSETLRILHELMAQGAVLISRR